ncbi:hypothetical protein M2322_004822 [Rhodoblastus acidophilus]|uniref:hypothetical protein n=1 Tax=Rhodoblastus acidophilus TaxID=1074 RepID=UPI00222593A5|nr:hypothetical protein [Rhodoblastus acidophilus]MCW2319253.1 hypothetical protein [Rhodoblastus acidophilus]
MGVEEFPGIRYRRLANSGDAGGVSCDENGPAIGPIRLLNKSVSGFAPRPAEELNHVFAFVLGHPVDSYDLVERLQAVTNAMNEGNVARAVFATLFMDLPPLTEEQAQRAALAEKLFKASPDDPKHPGWPKGTEGGRGGQFRPKTDAERFGIGGNNGPPLEGESSPSGKIMTRALAGAIKGAIRGGWAGAVAGAVSEAAYPYVKAYFDPPQSLEDLQSAAQSPPELGYDDHHIVEQATAAADGGEAALIAAPDNLARIPTVKHWQLNGWYETSNPSFNEMTPRQYLKGKSWEERFRVGLQGLRDVGVLQ